MCEHALLLSSSSNAATLINAGIRNVLVSVGAEGIVYQTNVQASPTHIAANELPLGEDVVRVLHIALTHFSTRTVTFWVTASAKRDIVRNVHIPLS